MAKIEKPLAYSLPVLEIESCIPSLVHENKVYARLIKGTDRYNNTYTIRERTGIEAELYTGKPVECVLEIVKARIFDPADENSEIPETAIKGTFTGSKSGYKFFQELVELVDGVTGDGDDDDFSEEQYETLAAGLFPAWGDYGFGLDIYQDKPIIKTEEGAYFLNEFVFEEMIDYWLQSALPDKTAYFMIEELLLHGIKPYEGKWEKLPRNLKYGVMLEEGKFYVIGTPRFLDDE